MKTSASYPSNPSELLPPGTIPITVPRFVNNSIVGLQDPSLLNLIISRFPNGLSLETYPYTKQLALIGFGLVEDRLLKVEKGTMLSPRVTEFVLLILYALL